jgi:hypothetical protein
MTTNLSFSLKEPLVIPPNGSEDFKRGRRNDPKYATEGVCLDSKSKPYPFFLNSIHLKEKVYPRNITESLTIAIMRIKQFCQS